MRNFFLQCTCLVAVIGLAGCATETMTGEPAIVPSANAVAEQDVTLTGPLTLSSVPERFVLNADLPLVSRAELLANLGRRGKLTLSQAQLNLSPTTPHVLAMDELRLSDAKVITAGSEVTIFVRRLVVDDRSVITSFDAPPPTAPSGQAGATGGKLRIYVVESYDGLPRVDLSGGIGGRGERGQTGAQGAQGPRGRDARNGEFGTCRRGPGHGGDGGAGGRGGVGGTGMPGGSGGTVEIIFINRPTDTGIGTYFVTRGGLGGAGGEGGLGGPGGPGGLGGGNAGNCTPRRDPERNRGAQGATGPIGPTGQSGSQGPEGNTILQRLDLPT